MLAQEAIIEKRVDEIKEKLNRNTKKLDKEITSVLDKLGEAAEGKASVLEEIER